MAQFADFQHDDIGSYKPGRFYSESFSGVPYESDLLHPLGVGREGYESQFGKTPGGLQKTMRLIVLLHETSHYVHDLSLGTCLDYDYILDQSHAVLVAALCTLLSSSATIRCPLLSSSNRYQWAQSSKLNQAFTAIEEIEARLHRLMAHPPGLARYCADLSPCFLRSQSSLEALSGLSLIEGLVAAKTLVALVDRIENERDVQYLQESKHSLPILPETLPAVYNVARRVFDDTIGAMLLNGVDYTDDRWPRNYLQSPRFLGDTGFIYLADVALHIPPYEFVAHRIETGQNAPEDFIPAYRFCKAIESLIRQGGFPAGDPLDAGLYYNQLYDSFAHDQELRWPTIHDTNDAWKQKLFLFKQARREAADGYRFRMLVERDQRPHSVVMGSSLVACWHQFAPVFHLTPTGFKTLNVYIVQDRWYVAPFEIPDMAADGFFYENYELWKDMPAEASLKDLDAGNALLLRQEIVYRSLCRELYTAMLYKNKPSCLFARQGCSVAVAGCKEIAHLGDIPKKKCCLRDYLNQDGLAPSRFRWL